MAASAAGMAIPAMASIEGIRIGVCAPTHDLREAVRYGFDYLEPQGTVIARMDASAFEAYKAEVLASPIRCECFSDFLGQRVVGGVVRWSSLTDYLDRTFARCRQLGGKIVVWSNPASRNVPAGYPRDKAMRQIQEFLQRAGKLAGRHGITIAVKPLRPQECNTINTGDEALQLVRQVSHSNVRMALDYYRLRKEKENINIIWQARQEIVHLYFSNPHGQLWPKNPSEDPDYGKFFKLLKKIHYHRGISIEGHGSFAKDAAASLAFFHQEITSA